MLDMFNELVKAARAAGPCRVSVKALTVRINGWTVCAASEAGFGTFYRREIAGCRFDAKSDVTAEQIVARCWE